MAERGDGNGALFRSRDRPTVTPLGLARSLHIFFTFRAQRFFSLRVTYQQHQY